MLIHLTKDSISYNRDICISIVKIVIFTTTNTWTQSRCQSTDEDIHQIWLTYSVECCFTLYRKMKFAVNEWNLDNETARKVKKNTHSQIYTSGYFYVCVFMGEQV